MSDKKLPVLVKQDKALTQYLDSLLMEIPEAVPEVVAETAVEVIDKVDVVTDVVVKDVGEYPDQMPEWGKAPFKALFFNVGEITLAVPLEKLSGILTECDDIKVMPGNSERYLGVLVHRSKTIRVIDFESLVAELSGVPKVASSDEVLPPNRIILIEGERIGIACRKAPCLPTLARQNVHLARLIMLLEERSPCKLPAAPSFQGQQTLCRNLLQIIEPDNH